MPKTELTNMVMIQDRISGRVLVQNRVKSFKGISFPGGHVELGESFVDSAIREIKEETGLDIFNLKYCGVIHWSNNISFDRYIVFLYKTSDFYGELLSGTDEGTNMWFTIDDIVNTASENDFKKYLPMFLEDKYNEAFGSWNDKEPWDILYL